MATTPIDWQDAVTLEGYVLRLFQQGKTDTEEYKTLERVFGKTKIDAYLKKCMDNIADANLATSYGMPDTC